MQCQDNTPTVGLGCRSGGYLIYGVVALGLLTTELTVWWLTHMTTNTSEDILVQMVAQVESGVGKKTKQKSRRFHAMLSWFRSKTFRWVMKNFFIRPLEIGNTVWLAYIVFAQAFGAYQTCDCGASTWSGIGGYLDLQAFVAHPPQKSPPAKKVLQLKPSPNSQSESIHLRRRVFVLVRGHGAVAHRHGRRPRLHRHRILHPEPSEHGPLRPGHGRAAPYPPLHEVHLLHPRGPHVRLGEGEAALVEGQRRPLAPWTAQFGLDHPSEAKAVYVAIWAAGGRTCICVEQ